MASVPPVGNHLEEQQNSSEVPLSGNIKLPNGETHEITPPDDLDPELAVLMEGSNKIVNVAVTCGIAKPNMEEVPSKVATAPKIGAKVVVLSPKTENKATCIPAQQPQIEPLNAQEQKPVQQEELYGSNVGIPNGQARALHEAGRRKTGPPIAGPTNHSAEPSVHSQQAVAQAAPQPSSKMPNATLSSAPGNRHKSTPLPQQPNVFQKAASTIKNEFFELDDTTAVDFINNFGNFESDIFTNLRSQKQLSKDEVAKLSLKDRDYVAITDKKTNKTIISKKGRIFIQEHPEVRKCLPKDAKIYVAPDFAWKTLNTVIDQKIKEWQAQQKALETVHPKSYAKEPSALEIRRLVIAMFPVREHERASELIKELCKQFVMSPYVIAMRMLKKRAEIERQEKEEDKLQAIDVQEEKKENKRQDALYAEIKKLVIADLIRENVPRRQSEA